MVGMELMLKEKGELIEAIRNLEAAKKDLETKEKNMRAELLKAMQDYDVWFIDSGNMKIDRMAETIRESIDGKFLRKKYPEIAEECTVPKKVNEHLRFTIREVKK